MRLLINLNIITGLLDKYFETFKQEVNFYYYY